MQDHKIHYNGREYTVPARDLMRIICGVEDIITLIEIQQTALRGTMKLGRIAKAFAYILGQVGCHVTDIEVYHSFLSVQDNEDPAEPMNRAARTVTEIISLMGPPKHMASKMQPGNAEAPSVGLGDTSKKLTKPGSAGDLPRPRSGKQRRRSSGGSLR